MAIHSFLSVIHLKEKWTQEELQALTEFVLFHTTGDKWPAHKQPDFWKAASDFMKQRLGPVVSSRSGRFTWFVTLSYFSILF